MSRFYRDVILLVLGCDTALVYVRSHSIKVVDWDELDRFQVATYNMCSVLR
jgi:hypothetical protein